MIELSSRRTTRGALFAVLCGVATLVASAPGNAGSLIYTPTNPTFGGNPNNGAFLLNMANAQNQPLAAQTEAQQAAAAAAAAAGGASGTGALTPGQIFAQQLQSQLLSSFANQITQAIFGPDAQTSGVFSFGATTISFAKVASNINISINDGQTVTNIVVPANP